MKGEIKMKYALIMFLALLPVTEMNAKSQIDSIRTDHLVIKTDMLFPIAHVISPQNTALIITLAIEYKINKKFGVQLNSSFYRNPEPDEETGGYFIYPEGRYYLKNHFFGMYTKVGNYKLSYRSYNASDGIIYQNNLYMGIGALYGYQLNIKRFQFEGRIGFGIAQEYNQYGATGNGAIRFDDEPYLDAILGINVGYRIF